MDALCLDDGRLAVNMVVLGTPPERMGRFTTTFPLDSAGTSKPVLCAVLANGQFRLNHDLVPRGHPGDGVAELHLYRVPRQQRAALRSRVAEGTHLPHPDIEQRRVREFHLHGLRPVRLELDGIPAGPTKSLTITLLPNAYRLLL
jgi:diacylglycerol kinase family enzyme